MGYLTVLHVSSGAKFGDLRAKDSNAFRKRLIVPGAEQQSPTIEITPNQHPPKRPPPFRQRGNGEEEYWANF